MSSEQIPISSSSSSSWQESLSHIETALQNEKYKQVLSITSKLLQHHHTPPTTSSTSTSTVVTKEDSFQVTPFWDIPPTVKITLQKIHCRVLLQLRKYSTLIDFVNHNNDNNNSDDDNNLKRLMIAEEEAYALYRLGRYRACTQLITSYLSSSDEEKEKGEDVLLLSSDQKLALQHILAQCYYRLHETNHVVDIYQSLLLQSSSSSNPTTTTTTTTSDDDVKEILTNAYAALVANFTLPHPSNKMNHLDLKSLTERYCNDNHNDDDDDDDDDEEEYPFDLAYNYASHLLLSSTSLSQTKKAINVLQKAEKACRDQFATIEDELELHKNVMPIQAQLAFAHFKTGDWNTATKAYLSLLITCQQFLPQKSSTSTSSTSTSTTTTTTTTTTATALEGITLCCDNNIAVLNSLRGSSSSIFDLFKRVPDLHSFTSTSMNSSSHVTTPTTTHSTTESSEGGGGGGVITLPPIHRITPFQIRIMLYNRALLLHKMSKPVECKLVLEELKYALLNHDNDLKNDLLKQQETTKKSKALKKKKHSSSLSNPESSSSSALKKKSFSAPTIHHVETLYWLTRIAILESESIRNHDKSEHETEQANSILQSTLKNLESELNKCTDDDTKGLEKSILEYAIAELTLYQLSKSIQNSDTDEEKNKRDIVGTLEKLPSSIQSRPAVVATMATIYGQLGMDDKIAQVLTSSSTLTSSSSASSSSSVVSLLGQKSFAEFKLRLGLYEEAATIYEEIIQSSSSSMLSEEDILECQAGLVKALSFYDIDKGVELASQLNFGHDESKDEISDENIDGEALESMNIPKLHSGSGSTRIRKILGAHRDDSKGKKKKKSKEAVLRQRAKKREAHLSKLQQEGKYNPDRPMKPDPERWIPKNQRSYAKRGRKGRHKFVGAQGAGGGADKDAAKLDAAARAAAKAEGKDSASNKPSTAHLAVSSHGKIGRRR